MSKDDDELYVENRYAMDNAISEYIFICGKLGFELRSIAGDIADSVYEASDGKIKMSQER